MEEKYKSQEIHLIITHQIEIKNERRRDQSYLTSEFETEKFFSTYICLQNLFHCILKLILFHQL